MRVWLITAIWSCSALVLAGTETLPVKDNYFYANVGSGATQGARLAGVNSSVYELGGLHYLTDHWLANISYSSQFYHPDESLIRVNRLLLSAGYRWRINEQFDVVAQYGLGGLWQRETEKHTKQRLNGQDDFLHGGSLALHYQITPHWSSVLAAEINHSNWQDEQNIKLVVNYRLTSAFALGGYYIYRNTQPEMDISEGGVHARLYY